MDPSDSVTAQSDMLEVGGQVLVGIDDVVILCRVVERCDGCFVRLRSTLRECRRFEKVQGAERGDVLILPENGSEF